METAGPDVYDIIAIIIAFFALSINFVHRYEYIIEADWISIIMYLLSPIMFILFAFWALFLPRFPIVLDYWINSRFGTWPGWATLIIRLMTEALFGLIFPSVTLFLAFYLPRRSRDLYWQRRWKRQEERERTREEGDRVPPLPPPIGRYSSRILDRYWEKRLEWEEERENRFEE